MWCFFFPITCEYRKKWQEDSEIIGAFICFFMLFCIFQVFCSEYIFEF